MKCVKLFFICIFIFSCNCFSQENLTDIPIKDSTCNSDPIVKDELQFKNFFRNNVKKQMGEYLMLGLEIYSNALNDSALSVQPYTLDLKDYSKEDHTSFKESFSLLIELAKNDRNK